ncbi:phospholipase D-like domain-containing protein [Pontiella sulfatireligans]|uniref:phospholipase D-like domain-containing protein n=1 Tax=Pontiella sulfatireligans TaxID=2750658 RepID=UPI00144434F5|nr:phospholipase D family protein [Pontiella sulfatireligans]
MNQRTARWVLAGCAVVWLAGCSSIPERKLENAFRYQRLKRNDLEKANPVQSEYQVLASKAWKNQEQGGSVQYVSLLETGDDALLARIHLIRAARKTLDIQTFIWKDDPSSRFVFDELVQAAERGVLVRILIDGLNMPAGPKRLARMARAHRNLEICLYKPLSEYAKQGRFGLWDNLIFKARRMNRRMHNKLLLVDGRIGIAGGRNYEGKYFDRSETFLFRDRDIVVAGPAVLDMQDSFEVFWQDKNAVFLTQLKDVRAAFDQLTNGDEPFFAPEHRASFEEIDRLASEPALSTIRKTLKIYEVNDVWFVYDTPRKFDRNSRMDFDDWFEDLLEMTKESVVYQTPYLIYNREVRRAFNRLHKKHPELRIIASSNSLAAADHILVYALSFKHRKELYKKSGIDIYEAKPYPADRERYVPNYLALARSAAPADGEAPPDASGPLAHEGPRLCIHAKSFVIDGEFALIGSHNFDPRSVKLNTECGVFVADPDFALELEARILNACAPANAWTVSKAPHVPVISYFSGFIGGISTALPFLDVWPYRYTTNYELKEGAALLSPRDPAFQENYNDVGYFPEVPSSVTVINTRLIKAFGGWARPLM